MKTNDVEDEEDDSDAEEAIWKAMKASMPKAKGDDDMMGEEEDDDSDVEQYNYSDSDEDAAAGSGDEVLEDVPFKSAFGDDSDGSDDVLGEDEDDLRTFPPHLETMLTTTQWAQTTTCRCSSATRETKAKAATSSGSRHPRAKSDARRSRSSTRCPCLPRRRTTPISWGEKTTTIFDRNLMHCWPDATSRCKCPLASVMRMGLQRSSEVSCKGRRCRRCRDRRRWRCGLFHSDRSDRLDRCLGLLLVVGFGSLAEHFRCR